jgi:hypothetical protein
MAASSNRKELFRTSNTKDKLTLFQLLFDAQLLHTDLSLALLKIIHRELGDDKEDDGALYKSYAASIEALRFYMSDELLQVVEKWKNR